MSWLKRLVTGKSADPSDNDEQDEGQTRDSVGSSVASPGQSHGKQRPSASSVQSATQDGSGIPNRRKRPSNWASQQVVLRLREIWSGYPSLVSEKDRNNCLNKLLPDFCSIFSESDGQEIEDTFGDLRTLAYVLSRRLTKNVVGLAQDTPAKDKAALAVLEFLITSGTFRRSAHSAQLPTGGFGFEMLQAISLLTQNKKVIGNTAEGGLGSTLTKLLFLFLDLPPGILQSDEEQSVASIKTDADMASPQHSSVAEKRVAWERLNIDSKFEVPTAVAGRSHSISSNKARIPAVLGLLQNTVQNLFQHEVAISELVKTDSLYLLLRALSSPVPPRNEPIRLVIYRTLLEVAEAPMSQVTINYIDRKGCIAGLSTAYEASGNSVLPEDVELAKWRLLVSLLTASSTVSPVLIDSFENLGGHTAMYNTVLNFERDQRIDRACEMVEIVGSQVFVGIVDAPLSDQPENREGPPDRGRIIRDMKACTTLQKIFADTVALQIRGRVLDIVLQMFAENSSNYRAMQRGKLFTAFVMTIDILPSELRERVLQILEYLVTVLNFTPYEELSSLCVLLRSSTRLAASLAMLRSVGKLVSFDDRLKKIFAEVGLIDVLLNMLTNQKDALSNANPGEDLFNLDLFSSIMSSLQAVLEECDENYALFREMNGPQLVFDFLEFDSTRGYALSVAYRLIADDREQENFDITGLLEFLQRPDASVEAKISTMDTIRRLLLTMPLISETFRNCGGFISLVSLLATMDGVFVGSKYSDEEKTKFMILIEGLFRTILAATSVFPEIRQAFSQQIASNILANSLSLTGIVSSKFGSQIFQILLGLAFECDARRAESPLSEKYFVADDFEAVKKDAALWIPSLVCSVLHLLPELSSSTVQASVLSFVLSRTSKAPRSIQALSSAGALTALLTRFETILQDTSQPLHSLGLSFLVSLGSHKLSPMDCRKLLSIFFPSPELVLRGNSEMRHHPRHIVEAPLHEISHLLPLIDSLKVMSQAGNEPPYVDLPESIDEIEAEENVPELLVPTLGDRQWPPPAGYSFSFWIWFDEKGSADVMKDDESPIRRLRTGAVDGEMAAAYRPPLPIRSSAGIFSIYSRDLRTFTSLFVKDGLLSLQTSSSSKVAAEFQFVFAPKKWHHVVVTQNRARFHSSVANLYVNGYLRDSVKASYPQSAPGGVMCVIGGLPGGSTKDFGVRHQSSARTAVDIARTLQREWIRFGPCYLVEDLMTPAAILQLYNVGFEYMGNFAGDLSSFYRYEVMNSINLRAAEDLGISEDDDQLDFLHLTTSHLASYSERIVFGFNARCTQFVADESEKTQNEVLCTVLFNSIAVSHFPYAWLRGNSEAISPYPMSSSLQQIGGVSIVLKMAEASTSSDSLLSVVEVLCDLVTLHADSCTEMERNQGYDLLAELLRPKVHLVDEKILNVCMKMIGYTIEHPEESLVVNEVMFRQTMLEGFDVWKRTPIQTQRQFLRYLHDFVVNNKHGDFNLRRMREQDMSDWCIRILRDESIHEDLVLPIVSLLHLLLSAECDIDDLRRISSFIISTLPGPGQCLRPPPVQPGLKNEDENESGNASDTLSCGESQRVIGRRNVLLEMICTLISERSVAGDHNATDLLVKVFGDRMMIFAVLSPGVHPTTVTILIRTVALLLQIKSSFLTKFRASGGFNMLAQVLKPYWPNADLYFVLFALSLGTDPNVCANHDAFAEVHVGSASAFYSVLPQEPEIPIVAVPDVLPIILSLALSSTLDWKHDGHVTQMIEFFSLNNENPKPRQFYSPVFSPSVQRRNERRADARLHAKTYSESPVLQNIRGVQKQRSRSARNRLLSVLGTLQVPGSPVSRGSTQSPDEEFSFSLPDSATSKDLDYSFLVEPCPVSSIRYSLLNCDENDEEKSLESEKEPEYVNYAALSSLRFIRELIIISPGFEEYSRRPDFIESIIDIVLRHPTDALREEAVKKKPVITVPTSSDEEPRTRMMSDPITVRKSSLTVEGTWPTTRPRSRSRTGSIDDDISDDDILNIVERRKSSSTSVASLKRSLSSDPRGSASKPGRSFSNLAQGLISDARARASSFQQALPSVSAIVEAGKRAGSVQPNRPDRAKSGSTAIPFESAIAAFVGGFGASSTDVAKYFEEPATRVCMTMLSNLLVTSVQHCSSKNFNAILESALEAAPALVAAPRFLGSAFQSRLALSVSNMLQMLMEKKKLGLESQKFPANAVRLGSVCVDQLFYHSLPRFVTAEEIFPYLSTLANTLGASEVRSRRTTKSDVSAASALRLIARIVIHQLTVVDAPVVGPESNSDPRAQYLSLLTSIVHNQRLLLSPHLNDSEFLSCIAHKIHRLLLDDQKEFREVALNIMKLLIQAKRDLMEQLLKFKTARGEMVNLLINGFDLLESKGYNEFINWVSDEENLPKVRMVFDDTMGKTYRYTVTNELKTSHDSERLLMAHRESRLARHTKKVENEVERYRTFEMSIVNAVMALQEFEQKSYYKWRQEEKDRQSGLRMLWSRRLALLTRKRAVWGESRPTEHDRWMLDPMEGPFRMRAKLMSHPRFFTKFAPHLLREGHRGPWYQEKPSSTTSEEIVKQVSDSKTVSFHEEESDGDKKTSFSAILTRMSTGHSLEYTSSSSSVDLAKFAATVRRHLDRSKNETSSEAADELEEEEEVEEEEKDEEKEEKPEASKTEPSHDELSPQTSEGSDTEDEDVGSPVVGRGKWWPPSATGLESPSAKPKKHPNLARQATGSGFFADRAVALSRHMRARSHTATQIQPGRVRPDAVDVIKRSEKSSPLLDHMVRQRSSTGNDKERLDKIDPLDGNISADLESPTVISTAVTELNRVLRDDSEVSGDVLSLSGSEKAGSRSGSVRIIDPKGTSDEDGDNASPSLLDAEESGVGSDYDVVDEEEEMLYVEEDPARAKILRIIYPEEEVVEAVNCSSVAGMDKVDGILVLCAMNLYVIDHFSVDDEGNVFESSGDRTVLSPELNFDWSTDGQESSGDQSGLLEEGPDDEARAYLIVGHPYRKWEYKDIREIHKRRYLLRPIGIELFSTDGRSMLVVFDLKRRNQVFSKLLSMNMPNALFTVRQLASVMPPATPGPHSLSAGAGDHGARLALVRKGLTRQWQEGKISNFQYLMHLNTLAGRSYKDLTQYPVFPWVVADYMSEDLDLTNPSVFRDLSKPMGALSAKRADQFKERFEAWDDPVTPSFHYATHYSTAAIVLHYLIRLEPFTSHSLALQSGRFDHPDRLFTSVKQAFLSASEQNMSDVRELLPEFFYLPEFLSNRSEFEFGKRQTGELVTDVELPPWAKGSPALFVRKHRQALESEYVSSHLHDWIDLIFGYKQQGPEAIENLNVFHYLTYEGAVDVDAIEDPVIKAATIAQINNFGQTPKQLFSKPHPKRFTTTASLGIYSNPELLAPSPAKEIEGAVGQIVVHHGNVYAVRKNEMLLPPSYSKYISFHHQDQSLRVQSLDNDRVISVHSGMHAGVITAACMSENGRLLVTGGTDNVVRVWAHYKFQRQRVFAPGDVLCGHTDSITCLVMCHNYSILVSGSKDKTCIIWDLARLRYVRSLFDHDHEISAVAINDLSGSIVTVAEDQLRMWSVNGDLLASTSVGHMSYDKMLSVSVSLGPVWLDNNVIVTGHGDGSMRFYSFVGSEQADDNAAPFDFKLRHILPAHDGAVTSVVVGADQKRVISGCSSGVAISWSLQESRGGDLVLRQVDRSARNISDPRAHWQADQDAPTCSKCDKKFTIVERRHHCRLCGKVMCNSCCDYKMELLELQYYHPVRVCESCFIAKRRIDAAVQMI